MADNDYICVYRQFFEEFAKTFQIEECRTMRTNLYDLSIDELCGEVIHSCVNFLSERKCPRSLLVPLTKIVVEEFLNEAKKQPEEVHTPMKFNRETHEKISEVCLRYTDNEKLSSLPGPVQETYYSTHSTKHVRRRMEDRLICLPRFNTLHNIQSISEAGYYGIFDGHGGVKAACFAVSHLHQFLAESEYYPDDPVQAFRQAFEKTETRYNSKDDNSGTAVLAILHRPVEKKLIVAWVGDSQAVLVDEDSYVMLVDPHKPERRDERKRIEDLGGFIIKAQGIYRVNGGLAISRAIGDKKLKPHVSAEPEIRVVNLTGTEHFIVMGCDGLWDVVEPQQVIETVYFEVKKNGGQIDTVGRRLVDLAKENNSSDNISVIVIFLTDPSEICNRSVDVSGHRPKILLQDGVIMEANFQATEKPLSDGGLNGIYETNGNHHFDDHMKNDSDEDFGPETDVDAIDDVLASPGKNLNPFACDRWQKSVVGAQTEGEETADKLIEFTGRQETMNTIGDEIMKFSDEFGGSLNNAEEKHSNEVKSGDVNLDKFPVDNVNPFEAPVMNNMSEVLNLSNNGADDSNKYAEEIHFNKGVDNFMYSNFVEESNEANFLEEARDHKDPFDFDGNGVAEVKENISHSTTPDVVNLLDNGMVEEVQKPVVESPMEKESVSEFSSQVDVVDDGSIKIMDTMPNEEIPVKGNDLNEPILKTNEEELEPHSQSVVLDAGGHPPVLCSVIDVAEAEKSSSNFSPTEENFHIKEGDGCTPELLSPSAPVLDGESKDEIIAESGGEVEDSEDDEWNYIKGDSGVQAQPVESKPSDLGPSFNESSEVEKPTMNSPLNPEADEFIPVSSMSANNEYNLNMTPVKAIPGDLADIIASSPNWNNMENVSLPEESAFLNEIKSRPSNIFENVESPKSEDISVENNADLQREALMSPVQTEKESEYEFVPQDEPHGIALASDMTSSFIDPSTMSTENEIPKEQFDFMSSPNEVIEKKEVFLNENVPEVQQSEAFEPEIPSKLPDLLSPVSPVSVQEDASPVSPAPDTPKSTGVEVSMSPASEPVTSELSQPPVVEVQEVQEVKPAEAVPASPATQTPPPTPLDSEPCDSRPEILSETFEKSPVVEEKPKEIESPVKEAEIGAATVTAVAAAAAATTAGTAVAAAAAAKKDVKKTAPKTAPTKTTKTPATSKPLLNGTKATTTAKKPLTSTQPAKPSPPAKTATTTSTLSSAPKAPATRVSSVSKTAPKPAPPASASTLNKVPARPKPLSTVSKAPTPTKTTVTTTTAKPSATTLKSTTRTPGVTATATPPKPKPRVPSAPVEKKPAPTLNGDSKSTIKRTEITKKPSGTTTTTKTTSVTRVSLSARPATAPAKPTTLKTTVTTTRTVTARPRTTVSSTTTASSVTPASKVSPTTRKSTLGSDKQAKELANRITSKSTVTKTNGVVQGKTTTTTTVTKTRKTLTSTTTTPSKTKDDNKTEIKAEKIIDQTVEIIQSENGNPLIENNKDINLINSIASD